MAKSLPDLKPAPARPLHRLQLLLLSQPQPQHRSVLLPQRLHLRPRLWPPHPQLRLHRQPLFQPRQWAPFLPPPTAVFERSTVAARCGWSLSPSETSPRGRRSLWTTAWLSGGRTWSVPSTTVQLFLGLYLHTFIPLTFNPPSILHFVVLGDKLSNLDSPTASWYFSGARVGNNILSDPKIDKKRQNSVFWNFGLNISNTVTFNSHLDKKNYKRRKSGLFSNSRLSTPEHIAATGH